MATTPSFAVTPRIGMATISTANTARDGSGTLGTLLVGGSAGTRINEVLIEATGNTTAGIVRLFLSSTTANVANFAATLVAGVSTITLTTGNTNDLFVGQLLTKVSGTGVFGSTPTVVSIQSGTQFTVSSQHATAGAIEFTASGTRLFDELLVAPITVSGTVAAYRTTKIYDNLVLPNKNWILSAAPHNAETFNVVVFGADL